MQPPSTTTMSSIVQTPTSFVVCCLMSAPFCFNTGLPHARCMFCDTVTASNVMCPFNGEDHFNVPTSTCPDCGTIFGTEAPHLQFCARTGKRHSGAPALPASPAPPVVSSDSPPLSPSFTDECMADMQYHFQLEVMRKRARDEERESMTNNKEEVGVWTEKDCEDLDCEDIERVNRPKDV